MAYTLPSSGGDNLTVEPSSVIQTGKQVVRNATDMGTNAQTLLKKLESAALPDCISQVISTYIKARETEFSNLSQHRQQVGQLLQKTADLFTFNEQAIQTVFKNMNIPGTPNNNPNIGQDLTPPQGGTPDPQHYQVFTS